MNPLLTTALSGIAMNLGEKALKMAGIEKLLGLVLEGLQANETKELIIEKAMVFVQPVVDAVEKQIEQSQNKIDDQLKPVIATIFTVLGSICLNVAIDLSDIEKE